MTEIKDNISSRPVRVTEQKSSGGRFAAASQATSQANASAQGSATPSAQPNSPTSTKK